jgi:hypothetical protein
MSSSLSHLDRAGDVMHDSLHLRPNEGVVIIRPGLSFWLLQFALARVCTRVLAVTHQCHRSAAANISAGSGEHLGWPLSRQIWLAN